MILPLSLDPHNWVSTIGTVWMLLVSNTSGSDSRAASMLQNLLCTSHHFTDYQLCVPTKGIKWQHHSICNSICNVPICPHVTFLDMITAAEFGRTFVLPLLGGQSLPCPINLSHRRVLVSPVPPGTDWS